jgi:hypothetical protein
LPAWHGHWIGALALKLAVEPSSKVELLLHQALEGLQTNFKATGVTGLLARAYLEYEGDERLSWMVTEEQNPTRFWQQGRHGFWFRNGVAKGHYSGAVLGLATVIGLETRGAISPDPSTSTLARQTLIELAHYLIDNKYRVVDANGEVTEFGELNDWRYNGFSALQLLAMLRVGKAIGDDKCTREYDRLTASRAGSVVATTLGGLGEVYARVGRHKFGHFSDDQAIYTNAFVLFLNSDDGDKAALQDVGSALHKLWKFLRYSRKSYMTFIQALMVKVSKKEADQALKTLRMFPDDKRLISNLEAQDTEKVQPIANQRINSHYWKTDYFRKATLTDASEKMNIEHSGQDYLFVYWIGRYFGFISEEEANAPVSWDGL